MKATEAGILELSLPQVVFTYFFLRAAEQFCDTSLTRRADVLVTKMVEGLPVRNRGARRRSHSLSGPLLNPPGDLVESSEQVLLKLEVLNNRLDDEVDTLNGVRAAALAHSYRLLNTNGLVVVVMLPSTRWTYSASLPGAAFLATRSVDFLIMERPCLVRVS